MKHQVLDVFIPFISFMHGIDKKKSYNVLVLMLDSKYKSMCLVTIYLGRQIITTLVVNFNEQLLLEAYKVLMPNRVDCFDETTSLVNSQNLFQQTNTNANTYKDITNQDLVGFHRYPIKTKTYKFGL